jgi:hypothetical protein
MTVDEANALAAIRAAVEHVEHVGENFMGFLSERQARRYHNATEKLRALLIEIESHT